MSNVIILFGGIVKNADELTNITFNNKSGFASSFTFNKKNYIHILKTGFLEKDVSDKSLSAGYYEEEKFLRYLTRSLTKEQLPNFKLPLDRIKDPVKGDQVRSQFLKIEEPYDSFCTIEKYVWDYDRAAMVLDAYGEILKPALYTKSSNKLTLHPSAQLFYDHNIGSIISNDFRGDRRFAAYTLALIALQIHRINKDVFPDFIPNPELNDFVVSQNSLWSGPGIFIYPEIKDLVDYLANITNFYNFAYANKPIITDEHSSFRLLTLALVLPAGALAPVSVEDKLFLLQQTIELGFLGGVTFDDSELILKIVRSVVLANNQNDTFLHILHQKKFLGASQSQTLFEIIYYYVGDNRIGRYSYSLVNSLDNRKTLIGLLMQIWDDSIYNPYQDSPTYTLPANEDGVYPESFFMRSNGVPYYNKDTAPAVLVYETSNNDIVSYQTSFKFKIIDTKVTVYKVLKTHQILEHGGGDFEYEMKYGQYHLYQPLSTIGFRPDQDQSATLKTLQSKRNCLPAFYLFYVNEYKDIKDLDLAIMLMVDVALQFTLLGEISDLGYIKYLGRFGELLEIPETTVMLKWDAVVGVNQAVQYLAGDVLAVSNYINQSSTDPEVIELTRTLNEWLGVLVIGSVGIDVVSKRKLIFLSEKIKSRGQQLVSTGLPQTTVNAIAAIAGDFDDLMDVMRSKLGDMGLTKVLDEYNNTFSSSERFHFYSDFYRTNDILFWNKANIAGDKTILNWKILNGIGSTDKKIIRVIADDALTAKLLKFYEVESIRNVFEGFELSDKIYLMSKLGHLEATDLLFTRLKECPEGLELFLLSKKVESATESEKLLFYSFDDVQNILELSDLNRDHVALLVEAAKMSSREGAITKSIQHINRSVAETLALHMEIPETIISTKKQNLYLSTNRTVNNTKIFQNNTLVSEVKNERFISGSKNYTLDKIFSVNNNAPQYPVGVMHPDSSFPWFASKAFDFNKDSRGSDTELKYIYHFLRNYYHLGNHFEIEIESILYTCSSCNKYLEALIKLAEKDKKTIKLSFKSSRNITTTKGLPRIK